MGIPAKAGVTKEGFFVTPTLVGFLHGGFPSPPVTPTLVGKIPA